MYFKLTWKKQTTLQALILFPLKGIRAFLFQSKMNHSNVICLSPPTHKFIHHSFVNRL